MKLQLRTLMRFVILLNKWQASKLYKGLLS
jgi:hypothetical protein